ncbi:MAG: HAMP domain-containing sensor histidine kinase [Actinomycetota bacterium]
MRSVWRTTALVLAVAVAGAAGSLVVAVWVGMGADTGHLLTSLVPAALVTVLVAVFAGPLLTRASLRQRFVAVALVAAVAALTNLAVLTRQMFLSSHDGTIVIVLVVYSLGAGLAAALVAARGTSVAVARLEETAEVLGGGDLQARVGDLNAGSELDMLARTLDDMASRLASAAEREREVESMRRDLITAVSHDLRTPLSSLRAMVEAIDDGVVDDAATVRRYTGEMRRSVDRLVSMVDDLFELVQLEAGAIQAETRRARLDDVVRSAMGALELQAEEKGLSMAADLHGAEAAACSPRLVRVLQNLLGNAVRHTPADGTITIAAHHADGRLALAVRDTGEGIPATDLPHIFEPFYRGDPARSGGGAGLGLALAKRIVEALGGDITAHSAPEMGARFELSLPDRASV